MLHRWKPASAVNQRRKASRLSNANKIFAVTILAAMNLVETNRDGMNLANAASQLIRDPGVIHRVIVRNKAEVSTRRTIVLKVEASNRTVVAISRGIVHAVIVATDAARRPAVVAAGIGSR